MLRRPARDIRRAVASAAAILAILIVDLSGPSLIGAPFHLLPEPLGTILEAVFFALVLGTVGVWGVRSWRQARRAQSA
jgi:hypothetical protein